MPEQNDAPILIVDLEATCWESSRLPNGERQSIGNMEIIEFGCALATRTGELLDSRSFLVRPVRNPDLSAFCRSLTGISQAMVNAAPPYPEVVRALDEWLGQPEESLIWCSWGNYDRHHIQAESEAHGIAPRFLSCPHLNLKRIWRRSTGQKKKTGLASALAFHNLAFEGRPHRGVDDARNIVRLLPFMDWELEAELLRGSLRMSEKEHDNRAEVSRAARLTAQAETVFGNVEAARRWLSKPKKRLSGLSPNEAMKDERGAELVDQLLKQIDSGHF